MKVLGCVSLSLAAILLLQYLNESQARPSSSSSKLEQTDSQLENLDVETYYIDDGATLMVKRDRVKPRGGMWFGPRLGRKKRSYEPEAGVVLQRTKTDVNMDDYPWAIVAVKAGKRRTLNFTPRLGRASDEDIGENFVEFSKAPPRSGSYQVASVQGIPTNFTPRLGRYLDKA